MSMTPPSLTAIFSKMSRNPTRMHRQFFSDWAKQNYYNLFTLYGTYVQGFTNRCTYVRVILKFLTLRLSFSNIEHVDVLRNVFLLVRMIICESYISVFISHHNFHLSRMLSKNYHKKRIAFLFTTFKRAKQDSAAKIALRKCPICSVEVVNKLPPSFYST